MDAVVLRENDTGAHVVRYNGVRSGRCGQGITVGSGCYAGECLQRRRCALTDDSLRVLKRQRTVVTAGARVNEEVIASLGAGHVAVDDGSGIAVSSLK